MFPVIGDHLGWDDNLEASGFGDSGHWMLVIVEAGSIADDNIADLQNLKRDALKYKSH